MTGQTASSNGTDELVLAALAAVFSAAGVVWGGAAVAAVVCGERLGVGLGAAAQAMVRLPSHASDPAAAWPATAAARLPGAALYWLCTGVVAAVVVGLVWLGWRVWRANRDRGRVRLGVDVRARFASLLELATLVVAAPAPVGRFVFGRVAGRLVASEDAANAAVVSRRRRVRARQGDRGSVAMMGPARCGKSANAAAGIRDWRGAAVVVSVKRDLLDATVDVRRALGEVAVFDPAGITGTALVDRARWSPLRAAGTGSGAQKAAAALAAAIPRSGVDGGADYWVAQAEILLCGLLAAASLDPAWTMADVATWVFAKDMPVKGGRPSQVIATLSTANRSTDRQSASTPNGR